MPSTPRVLHLHDIRIKGRAKPIAATEVDEAESHLSCRFPRGYREYITALGVGILGGSLMRVYSPGRIVRELADFRQRWSDYWFWDAGSEILSKEKAQECVIVADTANGDEVLFHPQNPDRLLVLPIDSAQIHEAGRDLFEAIEWLCGSGVVTKKFRARTFEPFDE